MPGLTVLNKDQLMSYEMAEFITDTIIIAKVKNGGNMLKMAEAINMKLDENFGGSWTVFVTKCNCGSASSGTPWNGTYIEVNHGAHNYVIFRK